MKSELHNSNESESDVTKPTLARVPSEGVHSVADVSKGHATPVEPELLSGSLCGLSPLEQQQLTEILDEYLQQIENGQSPDADQLLEKYPQWSAVLTRYLESLGILHNAARAMHGSEPALGIPSTLAGNRQLGDYEIRRQIGRGGMGIVYEARQLSLDRRVALKVLPLAAVLDKRQIARFRREAQAAAQLHHPHIVPVFGVGCEEGVHFYSMQLIEGHSIDRVLRSMKSDAATAADSDATISITGNWAQGNTATDQHDSTIDEAIDPELDANLSFSQTSSVVDRKHITRVAELGIQAASAIQHAHDYGVIHRDIKPSNLMLDRDGKLWITDFGLAHVQSEVDMTATGDIVGALRYMSPEQAKGVEVVDQRTDIYSLGITLYEMLTLEQAVPGANRNQLLRAIETHEPKRLRRINPAIPVDLETIILKATTKDRDQRYLHAQELADDLQRYLDGKPTLARRPTLVDLSTKWALRHRGLVAGCIIMLAAALIGTSTSLVLIQRAQAKATAEAARASENEQRAIKHELLANARRHQAIETLEQITQYSKRLTKQTRVQREIQMAIRDLFVQFVQQADDNTTTDELAATHSRIAGMSEQLGDYQTAIENYGAAVEMYDQLDRQVDAHDRALCLNNLGQVLTRVGRTTEAADRYRLAMSILTTLEVASDEQRGGFNVQAVRLDIALVAGNLGFLAQQHGDHPQAVEFLNNAVALRQQALETNPKDASNLIRLASNYHNLSALFLQQDLQQAEQFCQRAIDLQRDAMRVRPGDLNPRRDFALSYNNLGSIKLRGNDFESAQACFQRAADLGLQLVQEAPDIQQLRHDLAMSLNNLGRARFKDGDLDGAVAAYGDATQQFENILRQRPHDLLTKIRHSGTLFNLAKAQREHTSATPLLRRAIEIQKSVMNASPRPQEHAHLLRKTSDYYADLLRQAGQNEQVAALRRELAPLLALENTDAP